MFFKRNCKLKSLIFSFELFKISTSVFLAITSPQVFADDNQSLDVGQRIIDGISKKETEWIESYAKPYKQEICGKIYPELSQAGFASVKEKTERLGSRCYDFSGLPQEIGLDFSSYQNIAEEIFFDALVRVKMDHLTCRQSAIDCLNSNNNETALATDFVDRLSAFQIYREKYRSYDPESGQIPIFSNSEKEILAKYFPGNHNNTQEFFSTWDPVTALSLLVNYTNSKNNQGFLFQEAFASLAQDEKTLKEFGKLNREQRIRTIRNIINTKKDNEKKIILEEQNYWSRTCRKAQSTPMVSEGDDCFFRPTLVGKKILVDDFKLNSLGDNKLKKDLLSKEDLSFLCSLKVRYGQGAQMFDNKMNQVLSAILMAHPARAIAGAIATRNLTSALLVGVASNKNKRLLPILSAGLDGLSVGGDYVAVMKMKTIYEKCTAKKTFKSTHSLTHLARQIDKKPHKTRSQVLQDCKACRKHPAEKKSFDKSCLKEATSWLISMIPNVGIAQSALNTVTMDHSGKSAISKSMNDVTDTMSLFFYNLSLTTTIDSPELPEISIFSEAPQ